jgi:hypothetical protein
MHAMRGQDAHHAQMGGGKPVRVLPGCLLLPGDHSGQSAGGKLLVRLPGDRVADRARPLMRLQVGLGHDQGLDGVRALRRHQRRDRSAHAVADQVAAAHLKLVEQADDRPGVVLQRITELQRPVAEAIAQEVDEH